MLLRLILLLTVVPLVELWLLLWISQQTSLAFTVGLVIATGVLGAALARWQGLRTVLRIQQQMAAGQLPADALLDGLMILLAAAVLVTPGVLTDAFGFLLLVPPCRQWIKRALRRRLKANLAVDGGTSYQFHWSAGSTSEQGGAWVDERRDEIIDARIIDPAEQREEDE